jgi:hypothetical protein
MEFGSGNSELGKRTAPPLGAGATSLIEKETSALRSLMRDWGSNLYYSLNLLKALRIYFFISKTEFTFNNFFIPAIK